MDFVADTIQGRLVAHAVRQAYCGDNLEQDGNYGPGYIGFSYNSRDPMAWGITHFTRWDRLSSIPVSHALIVINEAECVEAVLRQGVVISPLSKYFDNNYRRIFFRKPEALTSELAHGIVRTSLEHLHEHFENRLLMANLINGTVIGHWLNRVSQNRVGERLNQWLDDQHAWICSELVAYCLQQQSDWPYCNQGVLARPANFISPQALFEDSIIFSSWHKRLDENAASTQL